MRSVLACIFFCVITNVIASGDDRFIKKYAMMKIYESCFGPEVVKQIRREMKEAYAKCASPPPVEESSNQHNIPAILLGKLPPGFTMDPSTQTITKPTDGAVHNQDNEDIPEKVHIQKVPFQNMLPLRTPPGFQQQAIPPYMMANQYRPYSPASPFYPFPYSPAMFYPQYNPYGYQQPQQQQFYQQPYFGSNRISRDLDLRDRLDIISRGGAAAGKVKNITCVMQELGYIDHDLEPNYEQITQRIANLPVSADLKGDIQDGLQFCQKFSQCVPDIKRDMAPLSQELIKPMFFFRCYKHKKLEACIMKDIRERFTTEDELDTDGDFGRSLPRTGRAARDDSTNDPRVDALDEMSVYLYDYLSGGSGLDYDLYL
ncbi:uncharacterized protein LOC126965863 [Leptidea sinapis]|uniref:uncharacterized protein LOC126965863 n=1 Tax=Leptidea sinapis TaxID=189913 RepID=UPI002129978A|nr:uncharacterized protein LOC126965863 [Leptidea sinapis]